MGRFIRGMDRSGGIGGWAMRPVVGLEERVVGPEAAPADCFSLFFRQQKFTGPPGLTPVPSVESLPRTPALS